MSTQELKPCPFCGGRVKTCKSYATKFNANNEGIHVARYQVVCCDCHSSGQVFDTMHDEGVSEAIAAWNRRAALTEQGAGEAEPVVWLSDVSPFVAFSADDFPEGATLQPLYRHPAPAVAEGFVMVPKEPTEAMQDAAKKVSGEYPYQPFPTNERLGYLQIGLLWKAMCAAVPHHPDCAEPTNSGEGEG